MLKKKGRMKLIFCADEHHSFLQIDTITFDECGYAISQKRIGL